MTPKVLGEIIPLVVVVLPIYIAFLYIWIKNAKKVWKRNKFAAILPIVIPLQAIFTLYVFFYL